MYNVLKFKLKRKKIVTRTKTNNAGIINIAVIAAVSVVLIIGLYVVITARNKTGTNSLSSSSAVTTSVYKDGSYTESVSYSVPRETNTLNATITLSNDKITSVSTSGAYNGGESKRYNTSFNSEISSAVVGKKLSDAKIDTIGGASLTSMAFNQIIDAITSKAKK